MTEKKAFTTLKLFLTTQSKPVQKPQISLSALGVKHFALVLNGASATFAIGPMNKSKKPDCGAQWQWDGDGGLRSMICKYFDDAEIQKIKEKHTQITLEYIKTEFFKKYSQAQYDELSEDGQTKWNKLIQKAIDKMTNGMISDIKEIGLSKGNPLESTKVEKPKGRKEKKQSQSDSGNKNKKRSRTQFDSENSKREMDSELESEMEQSVQPRSTKIRRIESKVLHEADRVQQRMLLESNERLTSTNERLISSNSIAIEFVSALNDSITTLTAAVTKPELLSAFDVDPINKMLMETTLSAANSAAKLGDHVTALREQNELLKTQRESLIESQSELQSKVWRFV